MKEQICLIVPPSIFLLDERVFPHLGVLKVAACLEAAGHRVAVMDLSGVTNFEEVVAEYVGKNSGTSAWYGITATTPQMPAATKIAASIRAADSSAKIMIGGPHPTLVCAAAKREDKEGRSGRAAMARLQLLSRYDCVVAGDGEDAVFQAFLGNDRLVDADDPKGSLFMTSARYDQTPMPARHLIHIPSYHYQIEGVPATSLIAQLGCPFGCGFCGGRQSPMLRKIRTRTTDSIVREIEHLYNTYGMRGFMFYDDELNVNKDVVQLMRAITDLQKKLGTEFKLRGFVKAELFTDDQASAMHDAGFRWLLTGFESGSPRILENINKKATRDDNDRCVDIAKRHDLKVKALMSVGHPGETPETVQETEDWLLRIKPDDFDVTVITTYPGSPYYDEAVKTRGGEQPIWTYTCPKSGDKLHALELDYSQVADYYKGDPDGGYVSYVYTDAISREEMVSLRDGVERRVRERLVIPFNVGQPGLTYEHSMGQGNWPEYIFKISQQSPAKRSLPVIQ
jgi:anaerobic magnesium-protoporphyrin IX monomethyl ester cyclase